jgi:hypothetical protein
MIDHKLNGDFKSHIIKKDTRETLEGLVALYLNNTIETAISLITILPQKNILKFHKFVYITKKTK